MLTIFFERSGEDAKRTLEAFRSELLSVDACREVKLLESAQQADLYLLVSTWLVTTEDALPLGVPEGTKRWVFREAEG